jgi:hypothetical protein
MEGFEQGRLPYTMTMPELNFLNADHILTSLSPVRAAGMLSKKEKNWGKGKPETLLTFKPFEILTVPVVKYLRL